MARQVSSQTVHEPEPTGAEPDRARRRRPRVVRSDSGLAKYRGWAWVGGYTCNAAGNGGRRPPSTLLTDGKPLFPQLSSARAVSTTSGTHSAEWILVAGGEERHGRLGFSARCCCGDLPSTGQEKQRAATSEEEEQRPRTWRRGMWEGNVGGDLERFARFCRHDPTARIVQMCMTSPSIVCRHRIPSRAVAHT